MSRFSSTTSGAAYSELVKRNRDLRALVESLHRVEAFERRAETDPSLLARVRAILLGRESNEPRVELVADARVTAPLPSHRAPSFLSPTVLGADAARSAQSRAMVGPGVLATVGLMVQSVHVGQVVDRRVLSLALVSGAACWHLGVPGAIARWLAALTGAVSAKQRYDARHAYACRVQELKFRYEKMARTLRSLRTDPRVMSHQREELHDLCALLARHESLIKHAVLSIGIRADDADAILAPLQRELHSLVSVSSFGSSSSSSSSSSNSNNNNNNSSSSSYNNSISNNNGGFGAHGSPRVEFALGPAGKDGRQLAINSSQQTFRADVASDAPRTEIVLHAAGAVSDAKIRRMQLAIARIFADEADETELDAGSAASRFADEAGIESASRRAATGALQLADSPRVAAPRRLALSPALSPLGSPLSASRASDGGESDDEFFSADEDEFNASRASLDDSGFFSPRLRASGTGDELATATAASSTSAVAATSVAATGASATFGSPAESESGGDWADVPRSPEAERAASPDALSPPASPYQQPFQHHPHQQSVSYQQSSPSYTPYWPPPPPPSSLSPQAGSMQPMPMPYYMPPPFYPLPPPSLDAAASTSAEQSDSSSQATHRGRHSFPPMHAAQMPPFYWQPPPPSSSSATSSATATATPSPQQQQQQQQQFLQYQQQFQQFQQQYAQQQQHLYAQYAKQQQQQQQQHNAYPQQQQYPQQEQEQEQEQEQQQSTRIVKSMSEEAAALGDSVFVYKFRHNESGVSDTGLYRQQVRWLRRAFELLAERDGARDELMARCEELAVQLLRDVLGDAAAAREFARGIGELRRWLAANPERARRDARELKCKYLNAYDAFLEWILLDAFADLANVPSALSWTPEVAKRALVVRQLDAKIAAAREANNEFQVRYYEALKTLTPHLVVGFTSSDRRVNSVFSQFQAIVLEELYQPLFRIDLTVLPANPQGEEKLLASVVAILRDSLTSIERVCEN